MKTIYTAWVSNDQGAKDKIEYKGNTSKRAIIDYVRANYGSGWVLHISDHGEIVCVIEIR